MKCSICQRIMELDNKFYKCIECGFVCKNKIYSKNEQYERYLSHNYDDNYVSYMKKITTNIDFNNKNVLDFGCGQSPCLSKLYPDSKFTNYDLFFYPDESYKNSKYDYILLIEVIEHLENPLETIIDLKRYLNDDGKILIHTKMYKKDTDFNNWWYTRDITHISFFCNKTFQALASNLGMKVEYLDEYVVLSY